MKCGYYKKDKLLKRFDKISVPIKEKLAKYYGEKFANEIAKEARAEFENIIPEIPYFPGITNIVFRKVMVFIAWGISFYKPMKKSGKTVEKTVEIVYEVTEESYRSMPKILCWFGRKFIFSPIFLKMAQIASKNISHYPYGWKLEYKKDGDKDCDWYIEVTKCGLVKFLKDQGVPEMARYCNFIDYIQSKIMGMGMRWLSHIGSGDKTCVACTKQGRKTEIPSNLKKLLNRTNNGNSK